MPSKPSSLSPEFAARFQHEGVVEAYQHRLPYPAELFAVLVELITD